MAVGSEELTDTSLRTDLPRVNEQGVAVCSVASVFEKDFGILPVTSIDSSWFLFGLGPLHRLGYRFGRRLIDLLAGLLFALTLALLFPVLALAIRLDSSGPIFFSQERIGQAGRPFKIFKLRTMRKDAESAGPKFAKSDDVRIYRESVHGSVGAASTNFHRRLIS